MKNEEENSLEAARPGKLCGIHAPEEQTALSRVDSTDRFQDWINAPVNLSFREMNQHGVLTITSTFRPNSYSHLVPHVMMIQETVTTGCQRNRGGENRPLGSGIRAPRTADETSLQNCSAMEPYWNCCLTGEPISKSSVIMERAMPSIPNSRGANKYRTMAAILRMTA